MSDGRIYYAEEEGNYYLKMAGDVRVTLCTGLNDYINRIFATENIASVVVDMTAAECVDSTTLGLLAKIALHTLAEEDIKPMMIVNDASMIRLIEGMGFDEIFEILPSLPSTPDELKAVSSVKASSDESRDQVIEAHKTLMSMNKKNMRTFSELVKALEHENEQSAH